MLSFAKTSFLWGLLLFSVGSPLHAEKKKRQENPNLTGLADFMMEEGPTKKKTSNESILPPEEREKITSAGAAIGEGLENRARDLLSRYIPIREFQISVNVEATVKSLPATPYDPSQPIISRSQEELAKYIKKVEVEVLLSTRVQSAKARIQQILARDLNLSSKRGDKIRFGDLGIEIAPENWVQEKNELKSEFSRIKQENERLNRDLLRSQNQIGQAEQAIQRAKDQAEKQISKLQSEPKPSKEDPQSPKQEPILSPGTLRMLMGIAGGVLLVLLLGIFYAGRSLTNTGKTIANSFTGIASAMENVGGSITSLSSLTGTTAPGAPSILQGKFITEGGGRGSGLANLPMESLHAHFMKLRQELIENISEATEAVIIRHVTQLLSNPATVGRAVVTLELLGRDTATELFKRLGLNSQEALLKFMREGTYEKSKIELMLEAGEELKTKLLVDSLDLARGRPSEKVAEKVLQLTDEDIFNLSNEINPELIPRIFLYLDAPKIAATLGHLKNNNTKTYQKVLVGLSKMPEAEQANHHDQDILRAIDSIINKTKSDSQRPFLKVYKEIIEAAEEDLGEEIVRELSADPRLDHYFKENVITIRTFFRLNEDARNELVEGLSNKEVASLAFGVRDDERKSIMQALPARRKGMIAEEFESLTSRGGRQAQLSFKKVRDTLVKKLTDMKTQGVLGPVLQKGNELAKPKAEGEAPPGGGAFFNKEKATPPTPQAPLKVGAGEAAEKASTPLKFGEKKPLVPDDKKVATKPSSDGLKKTGT